MPFFAPLTCQNGVVPPTIHRTVFTLLSLVFALCDRFQVRLAHLNVSRDLAVIIKQLLALT